MSESDREALIQSVNMMMGQVPSFIKGAFGKDTALAFMRVIPESFKRYTLSELLEVMEGAISDERIRFN